MTQLFVVVNIPCGLDLKTYYQYIKARPIQNMETSLFVQRNSPLPMHRLSLGFSRDDVAVCSGLCCEWNGWWEGVMDGITGLFPGNYVEATI